MTAAWRDRLVLVGVMAAVVGLATFALFPNNSGVDAVETAAGLGPTGVSSPDTTADFPGPSTNAEAIPTTINHEEFQGQCGGTGGNPIPCMTPTPVPPDLPFEPCEETQTSASGCAHTTTGPRAGPPHPCGGTAVTTIPCEDGTPLQDIQLYCAAINQLAQSTGSEYTANLDLASLLAVPEHARMWELLSTMNSEPFAYSNFNKAADEAEATMPDIDGMCGFQALSILVDDDGRLTARG